MFHSIRPSILERMRTLEEMDARDRQDGTSILRRLRQIPPETGRFLALMAATTPEGEMIEIGTSAGYSTMWISLACDLLGRELTTFEILAEKAILARETFNVAQIQEIVNLVECDALDALPHYEKIAFCFLDAEKDLYSSCYEAVIPKLVKGGILVADNAINHQAALQPMLDRALADDRVDAMIVPIGKGELICRKI